MYTVVVYYDYLRVYKSYNGSLLNNECEIWKALKKH